MLKDAKSICAKSLVRPSLTVGLLTPSPDTGYHWIFRPPAIMFEDFGDIQHLTNYYLDLSSLALRWVLILLVVIGLVLVVQDRKASDTH